MNMVEPMEVAIPDILNIKASGTTIAKLSRYGNNPDLYVVTDIDQKMELISFVTLMETYWRDKGRKVYQMVLDIQDNECIMIYLDKEHLPNV